MNVQLEELSLQSAVGVLSPAELALPVAVGMARERGILVLDTCRHTQEGGRRAIKGMYVVFEVPNYEHCIYYIMFTNSKHMHILAENKAHSSRFIKPHTCLNLYTKSQKLTPWPSML